MKSARVAIITFLLACGVSVFPAAVTAQQQPDCGDRATALTLFQQRIDSYAALRRRLEDPLPRMTAATQNWSMFLAKRYLASAIRSARRSGRQGDILSSEIACVFRTLVEETDTRAFPVERGEAEAPGETEAYVNEPYPADAMRELPAVLLRQMPTLPDGLEYRIAGHTLLLWDAHAELVVDFVPGVFPS